MRIRSPIECCCSDAEPDNLQAQISDKDTRRHIPGFENRNASELSKYINSTVELLLLDKEDFYKKMSLRLYLKISSLNIKRKILSSAIREELMKHSTLLETWKTEKGDFRVYFL